MSDKYKNMTSEELTKAFEKLGIVKMSGGIESAEDPNIRFSKFDSCSVNTTEYDDGRISEHRSYTRLSDTFERVYQVLKDWYEIDEPYIEKTKKDIFPSYEYSFKSKYLNHIRIHINHFHNHLYKIKIGYDYDSQWYEIGNLEKDLSKILNEEIDKCDDVLVKREVKLKSLLC